MMVLSQRELRKRKGSTVDATVASNVQLQQQLTAATQQNNQQQQSVISQQVGNTALVVAANGSQLTAIPLSGANSNIVVNSSFPRRVAHSQSGPSLSIQG